MKKKKIDYTESSGNVFADLNLENPEEALVKAELARLIGRVIRYKNLTQVQAALLLGLDQPKISALINGKLNGFSLERLFRFLMVLGQNIMINVAPRAQANEKGYLKVSIQEQFEVRPSKSR